MTTTTPSLPDNIFLGRQPILDQAQAVAGYELLFRTSLENQANVVSPVEATADVICSSFAELGLAAALGGKKAFINVDEAFLRDDVVELLLKCNVVFEADHSTIELPGVIDRCRSLHGKGLEFSVAGVTDMTPELRGMMGIVSFIKVDALGVGPAALENVAARLKSAAPRLLAGRVETMEVMDRCRRAGFAYFQGYYFARPTIILGRRLDPSTQGLLHIIAMLQEDVDVAKLETVFKREPALAINLLRLTNSVGVGLTNKVASVRQAIAVLGRRQLLRWLQLLLFSCGLNHSPVGNNPLMQLAALRARLMEILAQQCFPEEREMPDAAFLCGLMSLVPAALGAPMTEVLASVAVSPEIRRALSQRTGELGSLLQLVEHYDNNDMAATHQVLCSLGGRLDFLALGKDLAEAIAWVQGLSDKPGV